MRVLLAAALGAVTISTVAVAQTPREEGLSAADAFPEPFSSLGNLRALSSGDLLVSDRVEKSVYKINFETGAYEMLGHNGQGPQEYDSPMGIFPIGDGASAVLDMGNTRIAVMDENGGISNTYPMMSDAGFKMPRAGDELGNAYYSGGSTFTMSRGGSSTPPPPATETALTRWNLESGAEDTVATLAIPPRPQMGRISIGSGGSVSGMPAPTPYRPLDEFAVAPDGRIGIVRANPYGVEWIAADGGKVVGPLPDYTPIPFRRSDKEAWAEAQAQPSGGGGAAMTIRTTGSGGGSRTVALPPPDIDEVEFPEVFPAFSRGAARISSEGDLWVQRDESYGIDGTPFDVFNSSGELVRRVRLPEGRTVLGFGPGALYAYSMDEDDLQWIEKYEIADPSASSSSRRR